jgi:hypothetical protein
MCLTDSFILYFINSSSAEVKEREELYLYTLSGPSWLVLEQTLSLPLLSCEYGMCSTVMFNTSPWMHPFVAFRASVKEIMCVMQSVRFALQRPIYTNEMKLV